jgi:hypothetical protein
VSAWNPKPEEIEAVKRFSEQFGIGQVALDVLTERQRQIKHEGYTTAHDDRHAFDQLAKAAFCYIGCDFVFYRDDFIAQYWPWESWHWKPRGRRRNLVRAAALILAEIERMDRNSWVHKLPPLAETLEAEVSIGDAPPQKVAIGGSVPPSQQLLKGPFTTDPFCTRCGGTGLVKAGEPCTCIRPAQRDESECNGHFVRHSTRCQNCDDFPGCEEESPR